VDIRGIAVDSRLARPGDLFAVMRGGHADGAAFVADAVARGAVALCAPAAVIGVPTIVAPDPRALLPRLAATLYGHPARALSLVGITGTLGKTSTALLVETALGATGRPVGVIGSLGVRVRGKPVDTIPGVAGMTTPDAPAIHAALRQMADAGVESAIMEVTSHALAQGRVAGLEFALGVFTNLVPDEHLEFHATPDDYVRTKLRFLDQLAPGAPLVTDYDDERLRAATAHVANPVVGVSATAVDGASVLVENVRADASGSTFSVRATRELPGVGGRRIASVAIPLVLPVFGTQQASNAALAATAALLAGASPEGVTAAVAEMRPIRRRMEVLRPRAPFVLDDTVGNPRSLRAVFESVRAAVPAAALRVAFGVRGSRGVAINAGLARALADCVREERDRGVPVRLVVTASEDDAGPRDRVQPEERDAVAATLAAADVEFELAPTVGEAVARVVEGWGADDAVLVIGAQGMDRAGARALEALGLVPHARSRA
jgi:UDP-N-acetylmuramoyl-L-alanyl-D-glutamate--2,6-diaminopimelate ligase